jgi:hypothetical protein
MTAALSPANLLAEIAEATRVLDAAQVLVHRSHLGALGDYPVLPLDTARQAFTPALDVRIFRIDRLVHANRQSVLESATAAYTALGAAGHAVFLYLRSQGRQETEIYIGVRGAHGLSLGQNAGQLLRDTFDGHFAGSALELLKAPHDSKLLDGLHVDENKPAATSVTAVTGVPALSTENREHFVQGLERLVDAAENRVYHALLLAEPVGVGELARIRSGYEQAATQLSPLLKQQLTYGVQDSESIGLGISRSLSESLAQSLGQTETRGTSRTEGSSSTETTGTSTGRSSTTTAGKVTSLLPSIGGALGSAFGPPGTLVGSLSGQAIATAFSGQESSGSSQSTSVGRNESETASTSEASSVTHTSTGTTNVGESQSLGVTTGSSRQTSIEIVDKSIAQLLGRIDHHLGRLDEARTYGGWDSAAYFIGEDRATSESLASHFLGLSRGNESRHEDFALTTWGDRTRGPVLAWLATLSHPRLRPDFADRIPVDHVTPATLISGKELAIQLSLPQRSTSTVDVVETVPFGRSVQRLDATRPRAEGQRQIVLGHLRHLWQNQERTIPLDLEQLTGHVFISGSTGSGKSNALYEILRQVDEADVRFLVVEPAKGEYKHVLGMRDDVTVLGTNPLAGPVLRINPFRFPAGVHVLEHADRLVEILSVCWPLYAAMPAVLKDAILQAYVAAGWDLDGSTNRVDDGLFPTFADLLAALERVVRDSHWSADVKADYLGALSTRVKSLTNGLYGRIFSADEVGDALLFDSNVLVDLSRVGSAETKALLMGVLIMRLGEYRSAQGGMNLPLRHVTVLEEAHNILRRPTDADGSVVTKAVEMLSNSIAEMRTWGEGFLVVDQSPHAVDLSAIRNTNTKIILRLPDELDRRLVGKSIGLRDDQLDEIARLPRGVAVVHQNDWLEPVLCQVAQFKGTSGAYAVRGQAEAPFDQQAFLREALCLLLGGRVENGMQPNLPRIEDGLRCLPLLAEVKIPLIESLRKRQAGRSPRLWALARFDLLATVVTDLLGCRPFVAALARAGTPEHVAARLDDLLRRLVPDLQEGLAIEAQHCVMRDLFLTDPGRPDIYGEWRNSVQKGAGR